MGKRLRQIEVKPKIAVKISFYLNLCNNFIAGKKLPKRSSTLNFALLLIENKTMNNRSIIASVWWC